MRRSSSTPGARPTTGAAAAARALLAEVIAEHPEYHGFWAETDGAIAATSHRAREANPSCTWGCTSASASTGSRPPAGRGRPLPPHPPARGATHTRPSTGSWTAWPGALEAQRAGRMPDERDTSTACAPSRPLSVQPPASRACGLARARWAASSRRTAPRHRCSPRSPSNSRPIRACGRTDGDDRGPGGALRTCAPATWSSAPGPDLKPPAAQHPGVLLVDLHPLREQVCRRLVVRRFGGGEDRPGRAHHRLLPFHELADHLLRARRPGLLLDGGQGRIGLVRAGRGKPSARMRSAIRSTAKASSVYCCSNIRCSVLNIGPVTFQW